MAIPAPRSNEELLAWAAAIIQRAQKEDMFGTVTIHLQDGVITRVNTDKNEVPPVPVSLPAQHFPRKSRT